MLNRRTWISLGSVGLGPKSYTGCAWSRGVPSAVNVTHEALSVTQRALSVTQEALSVTQRALSVTQRALSVTQRALSVTQRALSVTQRALSVTQRALSVTQRARSVTQRAPRAPRKLTGGAAGRRGRHLESSAAGTTTGHPRGTQTATWIVPRYALTPPLPATVSAPTKALSAPFLLAPQQCNHSPLSQRPPPRLQIPGLGGAYAPQHPSHAPPPARRERQVPMSAHSVAHTVYDHGGHSVAHHRGAPPQYSEPVTPVNGGGGALGSVFPPRTSQ